MLKQKRKHTYICTRHFIGPCWCCISPRRRFKWLMKWLIVDRYYDLESWRSFSATKLIKNLGQYVCKFSFMKGVSLRWPHETHLVVPFENCMMIISFISFSKFVDKNPFLPSNTKKTQHMNLVKHIVKCAGGFSTVKCERHVPILNHIHW